MSDDIGIDWERMKAHLVMTPERRRRIDMLRRDYLSNEAKQYLVTNECADLGHIPKVDKPMGEKRDWEKGCVCSARKWV